MPGGTPPARAGPLPGSWGDPGAFPRLEDLAMENNSLAGPLPERWGQPGSFPRVWRMCAGRRPLPAVHMLAAKEAGQCPGRGA